MERAKKSPGSRAPAARTQPSGRALGCPRPVRVAGLAILTVIVCVGLVEPPSRVGVTEFDDSWRQALAHFMTRGWQAGADYVFTYGPLGYMGTNTFSSRLFWLRLGWETAAALVVGLALVRVWLRLDKLASRLLLGYVLLTTSLPHVEARFGLAMLLGFLWLAEADRGLLASACCFGLVASAGLVKFTLLALGASLTLILAASFALRGRWRVGLLQLGLFAGAYLVEWVFVGQSPANIPAYIVGSWELSRGYAWAMALAANGRMPVGLLLLALALVSVVAAGWRRFGDVRVLTRMAMLLGTLLLAWKEGFVRQDLVHLGAFFSFMVIFPYAVRGLTRGSERAGRWVDLGLSVAVTAGAWSQLPLFTHSHPWPHYSPVGLIVGEWARLSERGRQLGQNLAFLMAPRRFRSGRERDAQREPFRLPHIREAVGDRTVDCFAFQLSDVLVGDMDWRPRPVFQSYLAYTPWLQRRNRDFFRSERAPEFVILNSRQIDGRLFTTEDSLAYLELCRQYRPILREKEALLLRRLPLHQRGRAEGSEILRGTFRLGEPVVIGKLQGAWKTLSLRVQPTPWGRLRALLYQAPPLKAIIGCTSPTTGVTGRTAPAGLISSVDGEEFLINPFVLDYPNLVEIYEPSKALQTEYVIVTGDLACYQESFEVVVRAYPDLARGGAAAVSR